jgi:hypothetical protein
MGLPTSTELKSMDYSYRGEPFVWISANNSINLSTMDYSYNGEPFVVNPGIAPHNIRNVNTVSWWLKVKKFGGKLISDINKVNTIEP